jgi:hypothetical protein
MTLPNVEINASDVFNLSGLSANFHPQSSASVTTLDRANMKDSAGNYEAETMINQRVEYTQSYAYEGTNMATDLNTFLTKFGDVQNSKAVTQIVIRLEAGAYPTLDITGHDHAVNTHTAGLSHGYANVAAAIATNTGFGIATWTGQSMGDNATPSSASITLSLNHVDKIQQSGAHFAGKNITVVAELSESYIGTPTTPTPTSWTADNYGPGDANEEFDTYTWNGHRYFDLATA